MTAEQLEELLGKVTQGEWRVSKEEETGRNDDIVADGFVVCENAGEDATLIALAPTLARRVIAAEKLVVALEGFQECDCKRHNCATCAWFSDAEEALTAHREASK